MANGIIERKEKTIGPGVVAAEKGVHRETVIRWMLKGIQTPAGRIRLEHYRLGNKLLTSAESVDRFIVAVTEANAGQTQETVTAGERRRRDEDAARRLGEMLSK